MIEFAPCGQIDMVDPCGPQRFGMGGSDARGQIRPRVQRSGATHIRRRRMKLGESAACNLVLLRRRIRSPPDGVA